LVKVAAQEPMDAEREWRSCPSSTADDVAVGAAPMDLLVLPVEGSATTFGLLLRLRLRRLQELPLLLVLLALVEVWSLEPTQRLLAAWE
jgi:hypothetical protein